MPYNISEIRKDFPVLEQKIHNKDLIYLDNSATTQKPRQVIEALTNAYSQINSNIHRGIHYLSQKSTEAYEESRKTVQQFINAQHSHEIIYTRGATESINLVASTFIEAFVSEGDEIIITEMEHHSNMVPWRMFADKKKAKVKYIPFNDDGVLDIEAYKKLINPKTKIVSFVHVSNSLGTVNPAKEIISIAHEHGIPVMVDAAQSIQHTPIDVQELDCEFLAFSGHKIYGPTGIGVLYGKEEWLNKLPPYQGGGDMIETVSLDEIVYNQLPFKFEAGTANYIDAIGLSEALKYVSAIGVANIEKHEHELMAYANEELRKFEGLTIYGNAPEKAGAISFLFNGVHPADVGMIMDKQGVAMRTGTHCTEPVMQHFGIDGTVRMSFGIYNTIEELETAIKALKRTQLMFL